MAKIQMSLLEQLDEIESRCSEIEAKYPKHKAAYEPSFTNFDKDLREGIVFYRSGWGWRLRIGWRDTLEKKRRELDLGQ